MQVFFEVRRDVTEWNRAVSVGAAAVSAVTIATSASTAVSCFIQNLTAKAHLFNYRQSCLCTVARYEVLQRRNQQHRGFTTLLQFLNCVMLVKVAHGV